MNMLEGMPQRQAALLLHALSEADRTWVMAALSEQERMELTVLLQELQDLNLPADPSWLAQWLPPMPTTETGLAQVQSESSGASDSALSASHSYSQLMALQPNQVSELARLLSAEPIQITLRLLRIQPWPWREKLLGQMSASAQMRLRQSLRELTADAALGSEQSGKKHPSEETAVGIDLALIDALARRMSISATTGAADLREVIPPSNTPLLRGLIAWWHRVRFTPQRVS
jgi:hypothetical protein